MVSLAPAHKRHDLMDAGRGFAILGILWLNIFIAGLPFAALALPGVWGSYDESAYSLNIQVANVVGIGVDGVMRAMISMLFGASALIMLGNAERSGAVLGLKALDPFFRRLVWLIAFGLVHAYVLLWPYDILYLYGLFGLFLFPLRNLSPRLLTLVAAALLAGSMLVGANKVSPYSEAQNQVENALTDAQIEEGRAAEPLVDQLNPTVEFADPETGMQGTDDPAIVADDAGGAAADSGDALPEDPALVDLDDPELKRMAVDMADEIAERRGGYFDNLRTLAPESFNEQTSEVLSHHFLDVMPLMLLGMALFKTGFLTGSWTTRRYLAVLGAGVPVGVIAGIIGNGAIDSAAVQAWSEAYGSYLYDPRRVALALANFSALALLLRWGRMRWFSEGLKACGRVALSLYVFQSLCYGFLFLGFGLALFGALDHVQIAMVAAGLTVLQFAGAQLYLMRFRQGPLEWLLRKLAHGGGGGPRPMGAGAHQPAE